MSAAFVERLPELLAARAVHQYAIARPWLFPDPGRVLDEPPWTARLQQSAGPQRGTLRFTGVPTPMPTRACRSTTSPSPVYHLDLLVAGPDPRRAKAIRYGSRPHC